MKTNEMAKKGLYVGIGAGLVLFVLAGLLPGSLIGGVIGLKLIESVFGAPMGGQILPRVILAVSMMMGVIMSALICILGPGLAGWTLGYLAESVRGVATAKEEALQKARK